MQHGGETLAVAVELRSGDETRDVQDAAAKGVFLGVLVVDGMKVDFLQRDVGGVPVGRIFLAHDGVVGAPRAEPERAVAHHVAGAGPVGFAVEVTVVFFDGRARHRVERTERQQAEHERRAFLERDHECLRIGRGETDGGKIMRAAFAVVLRTSDPVRVDGIFRAEFRLDDAAEAVEEIVGGQGIAVAPLQAGAQVERVRLAVGRNVPAFRRPGHDAAAIRRVLDQPFKECAEDRVFRAADSGGGVEIARFGGVADVENPRALAAVGGGFVPAATGREQKQTGEKYVGGFVHLAAAASRKIPLNGCSFSGLSCQPWTAGWTR